jgi:hypothetical protein
MFYPKLQIQRSCSLFINSTNFFFSFNILFYWTFNAVLQCVTDTNSLSITYDATAGRGKFTQAYKEDLKSIDFSPSAVRLTFA